MSAWADKLHHDGAGTLRARKRSETALRIHSTLNPGLPAIWCYLCSLALTKKLDCFWEESVTKMKQNSLTNSEVCVGYLSLEGHFHYGLVVWQSCDKFPTFRYVLFDIFEFYDFLAVPVILHYASQFLPNQILELLVAHIGKVYT